MNRRHANSVSQKRTWKKTAVAAAVSLAIAESIQAEEAPRAPDDSHQQSDALQEVVVSATRRLESIQKIPFNIAAIDGSQIAEKGLTGLSDLLRQTPGVFLADQGRDTAGEIVARGLSVGGTHEPGFANNDVGGVVSTYLGEIPVFVDLRLTDLERVEVLLGPQGTLYGAGTLGGAIRYLPRKPQLAATELALRGDTYTYSESDGVGTDAGFTFNLPLGEIFAFRANLDYLHDPGFVDDKFIVREPGVSDPEPDFSNSEDVARNLRRVKDANKERTWSAHAALRWKPVDAVDAILNFYFQDQEVDAATSNHLAAFGTGRYESADRILQFQNRRNRILSLEVTGDLGFAELTSATGYTRYDGQSNSDITDLLNTLGYSYELFPGFVDYSPWSTTQNRLSQEVRLVSKGEGRLGWIVGGFFDRKNTFTDSPEYAPGFDQFAVDNLGGVRLRPDALEYANQNKVHEKELAAFGEISYKFTDAWKVIGGARWYDYDQTTAQAADTPLYRTVYLGDDPNSVFLVFDSFRTKHSGTLFKFSTSYDFTEDLMAYFTRSEGYRIGSSNPYPQCPILVGICVLPDEKAYRPDQTVNWELGLRSQWFEHRLTANASLFYIQWKDPQLSGTTAVGSGGITLNGEGARTRGVDLSINAAVTHRLRVVGNYSYTDAQLTARAHNLIRSIPAPGTNPDDPFATVRSDGLAGDRLPHSPRHQGSLSVSYEQPLGGERQLAFHYGVTAISSVLTTVGGRGGGETLGGYTLHFASAALESRRWALTLYADNLFNKFAKTGVSRNRNYIQQQSDINGDAVTMRWYSTSFVTPRQMGLRFTYNFDM